MLAELAKQGGVLLDARRKSEARGRDVPGRQARAGHDRAVGAGIAEIAGLGATLPKKAASSWWRKPAPGHRCPFSGEKLAPVLAVYKARDFDEAFAHHRAHLRLPGQGPFGRHPHARRRARHAPRAGDAGLPRDRQPGARIATGGSFDNGLPFSLSMGCGTWGGNSFSDNMHYRHFLNITRIARVIPENDPGRRGDLRRLFAKHGA